MLVPFYQTVSEEKIYVIWMVDKQMQINGKCSNDPLGHMSQEKKSPKTQHENDATACLKAKENISVFMFNNLFNHMQAFKLCLT